ARVSTCTSPAVVAALARGQATCTRATFGGSPASLRGGRGPNGKAQQRSPPSELRTPRNRQGGGRLLQGLVRPRAFAPELSKLDNHRLENQNRVPLSPPKLVMRRSLPEEGMRLGKLADELAFERHDD